MENPFKTTFESGKENVDKKYGLNVRAVLEFGRHEEPGKTPEGMSADYLTETGKQNAANRGRGIDEANVAAYASPKQRAQETVDLQMQSADIFSEGAVNVVNKKLSNLPEGLTKDSSQKEGNEFKVKLAQELDTVEEFKKIMPLAKEWAQQQIGDGSKRSAYDLIIQYYLDNSELCQKEGVDTPHEVATQIAYRVAREVGMTEKFLNNTEIRLVNITHGPKLEPFLLAIVDDFKTLEDMGDAIKPGESFEIEVATDDNGKREVRLKLRGKSYEINEKKLELLAHEYRDKILKERKE
ncbi:histidine phosphatase family protein [Patescibacteria group bacterium]|nr:histidine phosphatase family protein [Patescibacteria group bacterium]